jgi:hypothetical protein
MLDWPEVLCAGQAGFEYPATLVSLVRFSGTHEIARRS